MTPTSNQVASLVDDAIATRRSVRAFLPAEVPRQLIEDILTLAARAPSGTNTQPWQVHVLTGQSKAAFSEAILAAYNDPQQLATHSEEYNYYPTQWKDPYLARRRLGFIWAAGYCQNRQAAHARTARPQLHVFRCASGVDLHHRSCDAARKLAGLRYVPAKYHAGGARTRVAHLPAGCLHPVSPYH